MVLEFHLLFSPVYYPLKGQPSVDIVVSTNHAPGLDLITEILSGRLYILVKWRFMDLVLCYYLDLQKKRFFFEFVSMVTLATTRALRIVLYG